MTQDVQVDGCQVALALVNIDARKMQPRVCRQAPARPTMDCPKPAITAGQEAADVAEPMLT